MAAKPLPDQALLLKLLRYEPETGKLFWRERTPDMFDGRTPSECFWRAAAWNTRHGGAEAFLRSTAEGYRRGSLLGIDYRAHRIIWKMVWGTEPDELDHENGNPADNRISNLRPASGSINSRNRKRRRDNTSGHPGVELDKNCGKWRAVMRLNGVRTLLGTFPTKAAAIKARKCAERRGGFHPNHGRS